MDTELQSPSREAIEAEANELISAIKSVRNVIIQKIDTNQNIELAIEIESFKIYESKHEFRLRIDEIKEERNRVLVLMDNESELSLVLNGLDTKISDLQEQLEQKIVTMNMNKIKYQEDSEHLRSEMDMHFSMFMEANDRLSKLVETNKFDKYNDFIEHNFQKHVSHFQKLQSTGWKSECSETRITDFLSHRGLKFAPSGALLTREGSFITFQEAQERGFFDNVKEYITRISAVMDPPNVTPASSTLSSEGSSLLRTMSTQEVKYLKHAVGKPLTLALAEITAKRPQDPIHYLGHYLFKYRYNRELEDVKKIEIEELTRKRKAFAKDRWDRFLQLEAKDVVVDMILRAEEISYLNELKRRELFMEEEDEMYEEEAKDTFE